MRGSLEESWQETVVCPGSLVLWLGAEAEGGKNTAHLKHSKMEYLYNVVEVKNFVLSTY